MKKIYITLNHKSRFMAPKVGEFRYLDRHQRLLWKAKPFETIEELSDEMNNALEFVERHAITPARVRFITLEEEEEAPQAEVIPTQEPSLPLPEENDFSHPSERFSAELPSFPPKRGRGRPPKNLAAALA